MNKELRDKWVAALRSGEYPQTQQHLKDACGYCCLGVLLDIDDPIGWEAKNPRTTFFEHRKGVECELPVGAYGMDHKTQSLLVRMNDTENASFARIADWIEQNIPVDES